MVRGKCMQVHLDKIKYDPDWDNASTSYDPLHLLEVIKKTILDKNKDQYPLAVVYK